VGYLSVSIVNIHALARDLRSDHSEVGPLAMVMVTKKRPKPRTHNTKPIVSSCQNKLSAWDLNDLLSVFRAARISARIMRLGRVPLYKTRMMGIAKMGVMIVTTGSAIAGM
jgi:hypothetical protein